MPSFPMTHANYRKAINACIASVILLAVSQEFVAINSWLAAAILAIAVLLALGLRLFCDSPVQDHQEGKSDEVEIGQNTGHPSPTLPVTFRRRPAPAAWSKAHYPDLAAQYLAALDEAARESTDREFTHHLLAHLLIHRPIHHKVPQTERIRTFLLDEFAGNDNPWMMDVPIGSVKLRIRGDFVELHVLPVRKQAARNEPSPPRPIFTDFTSSRIVSGAH